MIEGRPHISNDVLSDPYHIGTPGGHPPVATFLGVPLRFHDETIGMIGVANRLQGYDAHHERLLATFANQIAVAIANARLYERQQAMISDLRRLHHELDAAYLEAMLHEERTRIAEGLHDRVAQILFSIGISASAGEKYLDDPVNMSETFACVRELANRGAEEIRRTVYDLSAGESPQNGLVNDLRAMVHSFDADGPTRFTLAVDCLGDPRPDVLLEELLCHFVGRCGDGVQLGNDVETVAAFFDHSLDAQRLAFDAP